MRNPNIPVLASYFAIVSTSIGLLFTGYYILFPHEIAIAWVGITAGGIGILLGITLVIHHIFFPPREQKPKSQKPTKPIKLTFKWQRRFLNPRNKYRYWVQGRHNEGLKLQEENRKHPYTNQHFESLYVKWRKELRDGIKFTRGENGVGMFPENFRPYMHGLNGDNLENALQRDLNILKETEMKDINFPFENKYLKYSNTLEEFEDFKSP